MALDKLGNPSLQQRGTQSRNQTFDEGSHNLLYEIERELRAIRIILSQMADIDIEMRDFGEDYDNQ